MIQERTLKALEFDKILEHLARHCLSPSGREAALAMRPYATGEQASEAAQLYDECQTFAVTAAAEKEQKSFRLVSFPETQAIEQILRSQRALLDLDALFTLREVLRLAAQAALAIGSEEQGSSWPRLVRLALEHPLPASLTAALKRCLNDDGFLRDESSPELLLVRTELRRLHQGCMRKVKDFAAEYNITHYLQDTFMTLASDRYVLPLKANFKGRLQGIIHDWSQTGETCYFEPMFLVEVNNRLQELKREEREEERKVMEYLTGLVREGLPLVGNAAALLTRLDTLLATGKLATAMASAKNTSCHCISIEAVGSRVHVLAARHPLLALAGTAQPIDLMLNQGENGLVISGGNAGGKTVCLKTLGLTALMTMSGLPVPCAAGASLPEWTNIHAFIGDEQSLDASVSTFTAQIRHLTDAWHDASAHSLILLDEFGAGTDPAQGAALAQAVLDTLLEKEVTVVAATHFPALKTYALTHEKVRAASVLFDPNTKRPLFRLAYDQVGASQALDVAREHGLPEEILQRAKHYLLQDGQDTGSLIIRLNTLAVEREKEITTLKEEQAAQRQKHTKLQERLERERTKLYEEIRAKAAELMHAWKAGKATNKQALKNMSALRAEVAQSAMGNSEENLTQKSLVVNPDLLRIGQQVFHRSFAKKGLIYEIDIRKNRVRLDMGGVTLWTDINDIEYNGNVPADKNYMPKTLGACSVLTHASTGIHLSLRLDMRGKRAEVALAELAQFLDKAVLAGRESVEIVHGRGTGVLRKEVHTFLRSFPGIASFALAPEDRGGDGMTIVHLR